jgi:hypothetical protein
MKTHVRSIPGDCLGHDRGGLEHAVGSHVSGSVGAQPPAPSPKTTKGDLETP